MGEGEGKAGLRRGYGVVKGESEEYGSACVSERAAQRERERGRERESQTMLGYKLPSRPHTVRRATQLARSLSLPSRVSRQLTPSPGFLWWFQAPTHFHRGRRLAAPPGETSPRTTSNGTRPVAVALSICHRSVQLTRTVPLSRWSQRLAAHAVGRREQAEP